MIDLHLHTTASDGRCTPAELVDKVQAAGVTTFAVTDHDTVAAVDEVRALIAGRPLTLVPGLEATAVWHGRDVHVLGYWIDTTDAALLAFLAEQRQRRVARVLQIGDALARAGARGRSRSPCWRTSRPAPEPPSAALAWPRRSWPRATPPRCRTPSIAFSARAARPTCRARVNRPRWCAR